jgi:1-acyl-sn-glycerol-3-phosphate acyltransferase
MQIGSPVTAVWRLLLYVGFTVLIMPAQLVAVALRLRGARTAIPIWYHRRCCKILGIRVERRGRQSRQHPTLYVSNHSSYLDITVLGSVIRGSFIAKQEVAGWIFFGWLAKLQRTVFVERRSRRIAEQRDAITRRLEAGDDLVLFPEGTSDDGNRVLPFKSALLSVAERRPGGEPLVVQPVSVAYTKLDGLPLGRSLRPFFAWYGDMELVSHLWQLVGFGRLTVVVHFHPPVTVDDFGSRKALSDHCQAKVAEGVALALSGRPLSLLRDRQRAA